MIIHSFIPFLLIADSEITSKSLERGCFLVFQVTAWNRKVRRVLERTGKIAKEQNSCIQKHKVDGKISLALLELKPPLIIAYN